jgi:hypothetical protein
MKNPTPGATSAPGGGIRYAVVRRLQDRLSQAAPGSHNYEVAERAITLALSPRRTADTPEHLERNVRRDAHRILTRARRRTFTDPMTPDTPFGREVEEGTHSAAVCPDPSPEELCEAADLQRGIEHRVGAHLGARGLRCLSGLLDGESPDETAAALGTAPRTVDRLRVKVHAIARRFLKRQEAE